MKKLLSFCCAILLIGCTEQEKALTLSPSNVSLHHGEQQYVHIIGEPTGVEWASDNEFVAKVDNGTITGNHVGTTVVNAQVGKQKGACAVVVSPKYFTYKEPIIDWSMTKNAIIAQKGQPFTTSSDGNTIYYQQTDNIFEGYKFENNVLAYSLVTLPLSSTSVADFLIERYELGYQETRDGVNMYYFFNTMNVEKASLCVLLGLYTSQNMMMVMYTKFDATNNAPARIHEWIDVPIIAE